MHNYIIGLLFSCLFLSSLSLWSVNKKKPVGTVKQAHGCQGEAGLEQPHWVSSVAALHNSDTVASGASSCERPFLKHGRHTTYVVWESNDKKTHLVFYLHSLIDCVL